MAERHWVNGGVNLLWSTTGNWSLTEGGAGGQAVPTAAEDVFFDAGSPDCTLNTATAKLAKTLTTSAYGGTLTFNVQLSVSGNITIGANTLFAGTTTNKLRMIAAGTWTTNGKTIPQDIEIGGTTTFTCTLADDLTTSGNLYLTNTTSTIFSGDFHITAAGTCTISGTQTITIVHDVTISGSTTSTGNEVINGLFNWNTGGLITSGTLTGTTTIILTGGTWRDDGVSYCSTTVTLAGDVIISGTILYAASATPTLTYVSGTITTTGSTLSINSACTLDTNGMSWNNITLTAGMTLTINSLLTVAGTLTIDELATTFSGTAGFTVGTLTHTNIEATKAFTFLAGATYTVNTAITAKHANWASYRYQYKSSTPGTKVIFTLGYGATQDIAFLDPTDMDSSLGQTVFSATGVITTCFNWSNDLGHGRIIPEAGGESVTVAGITKDNAGVALGSCDVYLFRDNGGDTATYIAYQESNSVTGAYSFAVFPGSTYFVVAFKGGATPVMDVTDRTVTAV